MYKDSIQAVADELWDYIHTSCQSALLSISKAKWASRRYGMMKRLMYNSIMNSSLGMLNGQIHYFRGDIYVPLDENDFYSSIYQIAAFRANLPYEDSVYDEKLKNHCRMVVMSKKLVVDNSVIVFRNCVLDVKTKKTYKFNKCFIQINKLDYDYEPMMRTYKWNDFLKSVLPEDSKREVLQMFLGAVFVNRYEVKIETMLILLGSGANGKSVIQETVRGVLGDDNVSKSGLKELCHGGAVGDQTVALINGKRLNYCSEIQGGEFESNTDKLKAMISGEPVYGRKLYQDRCEARNIPLIMANANTMPSISDRSYGMMRRICVIPFEVTVPLERRNPHLADELRDEYPGIMNWILQGRDMLAERGYKLPYYASTSDIIKDGEMSYSAPLAFMRHNGWMAGVKNVTLESMLFMKASILYGKYKAWCELNTKECVSKIRFAKDLTAAGYESRRRGGCNGYMIYSKGYIETLKRNRYSKETLEKNAKVANPKADVMTVDGEVWATSMKALAAISGVGYSVIQGLNLRGKFKDNGCVMAHREKRIYNLKKCIDVMREEKVVVTDEEKMKIRFHQRELKYERYVFNQAMIYHKLPYRKYANGEPQITGVTVVDETMTEWEAFELAHKELGFDLSKVRKDSQSGAGGRGGKGFTKDLLESKEEQSKIEDNGRETGEKETSGELSA